MTGTAKELVFQLARIADTDEKVYDVIPHKEKRSLNANGLLWHCIGKIAATMRLDKWDVYLDLLKHYGVYNYVVIKPSAVNTLCEKWRITEVLGEIEVGEKKEKGVQVLCYYGSSTYTTKEFSVLLDGTIETMKNIGLEPPTSVQMQEALLAWSKLNGE